MDDLIKYACRNLRRNMTPAEILFWNTTRRNKIGIKIYRQKAIFVQKEDSWLDRWIIADFYSPEHKLVIEVDGWIHKQKEIYELDKEKEKLLKLQWYKILRFTNEEVTEDIDTVVGKIKSLPWIPTL